MVKKEHSGKVFTETAGVFHEHFVNTGTNCAAQNSTNSQLDFIKDLSRCSSSYFYKYISNAHLKKFGLQSNGARLYSFLILISWATLRLTEIFIASRRAFSREWIMAYFKLLYLAMVQYQTQMITDLYL